MVRSLIQSKAVLELCGSDLLLPSVNSVAEEPGEAEKISSHVRRNFRSLQSRLVGKEFEAASYDQVLDLLSGAQASSSSRPRAQTLPAGSVEEFHASVGTRAGTSTGASTVSSGAPTLAILEETLAVGATLLERWAREEPDGKVPVVAKAVAECHHLTQSLSKLPPRDGGRLASFLSDLVARLKALPPGGLAVVPVGWLRRPAQKEADVDDGGHCLLLVLVRNLFDDHFSVAVVNSGEGVQYHPVRASGEAPRPELPLRQCPLVLSDIPRSRATCGTFWYLLFRQIVRPSSSNGPHLLYATLLPMLNKQPLAANFGKEPTGWSKFYQSPVTGDGSFMICLLRTVRFCLRASGVPEEAADWSGVQLRRYVIGAVGDSLSAPSASIFKAGELELARSAARSLACSAAEHVCKFGEAREAEMKDLQLLVEKVQERAWQLEGAERSARSVLPPACAPEVVSGVRLAHELRFGDFERLLAEPVESLKGEVDPPRIAISVPTSVMPMAVRNPFEASDCCRLASHLLTLLSNQAEHMSQSALTRFALISRLMTQLLPMPLPVDHPQKASRCFWMQDMKQETKSDLMRHLFLIARHFAAVCFALRASRETDGARVVVSAAIAAVMDALLRRPLTDSSHGSLPSTHYSGLADGPTLPFGIDPGIFREVSETLLLVAPEHQALRALILDYFDSVRLKLHDDHIVFDFDKEMSCTEGDFAFVEQIGLCLGLDGARREAAQLLTGERPELLELFPELAWFRDVVFLWKMLLLPAGDCPVARNWRASDSLLRWTYKNGRFEVHGFGSTKLSPEVVQRKSSHSFIQGVLRWFGRYQSDNKSLSQASPTVLTGTTELNTEDDVLFLNQLPSFNGALGPADSELLLTYLTAPYLRIPLLLGFFTDRHRVSALREPQIQAVLDAALFEPGQWQPRSETNSLPDLVPAPNRRHLATPAGLLFNELMRSPKPVLEAVLCMLRVAVEKDVGRPDSGNEGLILYIIRLAVRVESYLCFIIQHGRRGAYLERSGASYEALVRGLAGQQEVGLLTELEDMHARLRRELQADVQRMLLGWLKHTIGRRDKLLGAACRVHAHMALLFKNVPAEQLGVGDVSSFLSAQVFLNLNHRWLEDQTPSGEDAKTAASRLGVGEVELFDAFEARRSRLAAWLREHNKDSSLILRRVEAAVTSGDSQEDFGDEWGELKTQPGDFARQKEMPSASWYAAQPGEAFRPWMLRTTQGMPGTGARQVSVNLGQYGAKRDGLELLPTWAVSSGDFLEAVGRIDAHCVEREAAAKRVWKDLVGRAGYSVQRWLPDDRGFEGDSHAKAWLKCKIYRPQELRPEETWLQHVLSPVLAVVPKLSSYELRLSGRVPETEAWLGALLPGPAEPTCLKEIRVQRSPPLVEVYNIIENGRIFYRSLCFSSDISSSFHAPTTAQFLLQNSQSAGWSVAAGEAAAVMEPSHSIIVLRSSETVGRQSHVPRRFLRGLLPDALLLRYRFWRNDHVKAGSSIIGKIIGEEIEPKDEPTRLHISLEKEAGKAAATVQRWALRPSAGGRPVEEDSDRGPETLVNLRRGPLRLNEVLARLENISHILAWAGADGTVSRVELPRLRLSFSALNGRLHCDQHRGFWFLDKSCSDRVSRLLSQWGGGTALLENGSGELRILVSALAEPMRPAAGPAVDGFLPTTPVLRRGDEAWVANLAEGSRHYYYPVHLSGTFAFAPTAAAGLYLLLCRFFTWHFAEAAAMASTVCEISTAEERQLWHRVYLLASAPHHPDAAACCLKLAFATAPYRNSTASAFSWDTGHVLLEYARKRHLLSATCRLSLEEELQLLVAQQGVSPEASRSPKDTPERPMATLLTPELAIRRMALQEMLSNLGSRTKLELPIRLGAIFSDDGYDRVCDKTFAEEVGIFEWMSTTLRDVTYNRPEDPRMKSKEAIAFMESLFSIFDGSSASAPFPFLYELFTRTLSLEVVEGDDSNAVASTLLRLCCRDDGKSAGLSVLRALELNPSVCGQMPKWGSSDLTWSFGLGALKIDTQSTSKLLEAAGSKLKGLERSLVWPRQFPVLQPPQTVTLEITASEHFWAPPLTSDVLCKTRLLSTEVGAEFGGRPLKAIADRYVQVDKEQAGNGPGVAASRKALEALKKTMLEAGSRERQATIERLLLDLKRASDEPAGRGHLGPTSKLDGKVAALAKELETRRAEDARTVESLVQEAVKLANRGNACDWICRAGGLRPQVGFSSLVAAVMAAEPGSFASLQGVNASLSPNEVSRLVEVVARALLHTVRVGQVARAQQCLEDLREEKARGSEMALKLRAQAVAAQLCAARHFMSTRAPVGAKQPSQVYYDPRLLVFEFLCNIMLRDSQVGLVNAFVSKAEAGESVCQQMIMGEGKTTVIAPLLVLLLADGQRLVCACTPVALLDMSRAVMAERFSSPVLPRPVLTFHFNRQVPASHGLLGKLEAARRGRAAIVAAPTSVKSVLLRRLELLLELSDIQRARHHRTQSDSETQGSWLRFPSWLSSASTLGAEGSETAAQEQAKSDEVRICGEILKIFHGGVMLLDEVDLLLDPLRSELNWPLGRRYPLDLAGGGHSHGYRQSHGLRYSLPFNLLDALFAAATGCQEIAPSAARRDAQAALGALAEKIKIGRRELKLQVSPHLVLLSKDFYMQELLPHLVDWAAVFVEEHLEGCLHLADLRGLLRQPSPDAQLRQRLRTASPQARKLLNLTLHWLHSLLPYLLSRVHRVSFGLLTGHALESACQDRTTPLSRKLLAVPFVGKDTPSSSSEFSHPDVTIGFTILAYRLHGLRERDAMTLLKVLLDEMRAENTVLYHRRAACKAYVAMITRAGGTVRGFTEDGRWIGDLRDEEQRRRSELMAKVPSQQSLSGTEAEDRRRNVWPLELLDLADPEQVNLVYEILRSSPLALRHLLEHHVFQAGTLDRNDTQLSASGQELAGPQLFGQCLGFSGTPNDLLPRSMGACVYAKGDDGKVIQALSSIQTVSVWELGSWTPSSILDVVAKARASNSRRPKYHALIDSGALVTGMTNKEVAEYLLKTGLEGLDGVLFLNDKDERVVLERESFRIVELAQCGLSPEQRFTFYDHVHTTGMDVMQPLLCTACLTLSKDMTFRDYAQGAYRMRGIGQGQQVELLMTPEVCSLIHKSLSKIERVTEEARVANLASLRKKPEAWCQQLIVDVISWLLLNGLSSEASKQRLLCQQDLYNLWRNAACKCLEPAPLDMGLWLSQERTKIALGELVDKMDFKVAEDLPGEGGESMEKRLRREASEHVFRGKLGEGVWPGEAARDKARASSEQILGQLEQLQLQPISNDDPVGQESFGLCSEQVQEQEQEQEEEAEEDQEQQVEMEEEPDKVPEAPADMKYARDSEEAVGWPLRNLIAKPASGNSSLPSGLPFYPMAEFAVNKGILNESCEPLAGLPGSVMLSNNYYKHTWRLTSVRRLKNVICFLELVPATDHLRRLTVSTSDLTEEQKARLREALELCGGGREDCSTGFAGDEVRALCRVLDLRAEGAAYAATMPSGGRVSLTDLEKEIASQAICKAQEGRFYVALSLQEAEHLRGSMHLMKHQSWPSNCGLALRCIGGKESGSDNSLLDSVGPVESSSELGYQLEAAEQIYRFLNSAEDFQAREINVLLRSMQLTRLQDRLPWWLDVRACRRRSHRPWSRLPLAKVFSRADEFEEWATKALLLRIRWSLAAQQLWPADAFRLMDVKNNGCLHKRDLEVGLTQLGVGGQSLHPDTWARQVFNLFQLMDRDGREVVYLEDFRTALELGAEDWEAAPLQSQHESPSSTGSKSTLPPSPPTMAMSQAPRAYKAHGQDETGLKDEKTAFATAAVASAAAAAATPLRSARLSETAAIRLSPELCRKTSAGRFKLKWQKHTTFRPLWVSPTTEHPLTIWAPEELVPRGKFLGIKRGSNAVKERISLGHYASASFNAPTVQLLEVTDEQYSGFFAKHPRDELTRFIDLFFPHPVRFRQIWRQNRKRDATKGLYVWEPIPPAPEYVATGVVCTTEDEAPFLEEMRCVPRLWAERPATSQVVQVWAGSGEDGSPASLWSSSGSGPSLLHVTTGASAKVAPEIHSLLVEQKKFYAMLPHSE